MSVFLIGYAKCFKLQFLNHVILLFFSNMNLFKAFYQCISINGERRVLLPQEGICLVSCNVVGGGGGGGVGQVPSVGHHVGGWVIFSCKQTVGTWY